MMRAAVLWFFASTSVAAAPPPTHVDPDQGLARAYFPGLAPRPAVVGPPTAHRENVLFIVVDAMRPDHMSAYGYDKPTTPFFAEFFRDGLTFLHHQVNAPWTRPSTASMLTGLYPSQHRTQTDQSKLPDDIRTLAQDLAAAGYQTAAVVGNGNASSVAGLDRGFQHYVDTQTHWDGLPAASDVYAEALDWLATKRDPKKPWFLFLFVVDPHDPYHAPPEYEKAWLPKGFTGEPRRRAHWEYQNDYPPAERDAMIAVYDAAIRYTDDQTRAFFKKLQERRLLASTSVVVTADHGDGFGEHGYYLHAHHHFDEIIRVPLMIKSRALPGSGHVFHLTQSVDLLPTIVSWAGVAPRAGLAGANFGTLLRAPVDPTRAALSEYNAFGIRRSALITLRWRVILQLPADAAEFDKHIPRRELLPSVKFDRPELQVYDRLSDPRDKKNLVGGPPLPVEARRLAESLRAHMTGAPAPDARLDAGDVPPAVLEDLRSLGYVQ